MAQEERLVHHCVGNRREPQLLTGGRFSRGSISGSPNITPIADARGRSRGGWGS